VVNVEEGFLPTFAESYVEHYGTNSLFVRAVSDYLTNALANLLEAKAGQLSQKIAIYAPDEAYDALLHLVESLVSVHGNRTVGQTLMHEACALTPIGSFAALVNSTHGAGCFQRWHEALEAENYTAAQGAVPQA
jgi:hypothetical protein